MLSQLRERHGMRIDPLHDPAARALRADAAHADVPLAALSVLVELRRHAEAEHAGLGAGLAAGHGAGHEAADTPGRGAGHGAAQEARGAVHAAARAVVRAARGAAARPSVDEALVRECLHAGNWRAARALVAQFQEEEGGAAAALSPSACDAPASNPSHPLASPYIPIPPHAHPLTAPYNPVPLLPAPVPHLTAPHRPAQPLTAPHRPAPPLTAPHRPLPGTMSYCARCCARAS